MHRIDTPTAQADKFGPGKNGFTNGDPATGRRATGLNSDMWDAVQEEICAVIEKSGLVLNKNQHDQLHQAIEKIITSKMPDALLKKNNLSDLADKVLARANLELKSAATADVQTSKDDVTAGRLVANGGALALRTVSARAGTAIPDASALPANSVSFCYGDAAYSPGYEATILDVGGLSGYYRVQYAASYADGGKRLKFRTLNGDTGYWGDWQEIYHTGKKPTAPEVGAVSASGGNYNGTFRLGRIETLPTESNMSALYNVQAGTGGVVSGVEFNWYGQKFTAGITRDGGTGTNGLVFQHNGFTRLTIDKDGNLISFGTVSSGGAIVAGAGLYDTPGVRAYSSNNPPPQQDLSPYATMSWVSGNFYSRGEGDARYQYKNSASGGVNGWFKDTSTGIIFQWGVVTLPATNVRQTSANFSFPTAFPNAAFTAMATPANTGVSNNGYIAVVAVTAISASGGTISADSNSGESFTRQQTIRYVAIGY